MSDTFNKSVILNNSNSLKPLLFLHQVFYIDPEMWTPPLFQDAFTEISADIQRHTLHLNNLESILQSN